MHYEIEINRYMLEDDQTLIDFCRQHASIRSDYELQPLVNGILDYYSRFNRISQKQKMCLARFKYWINHIAPIPSVQPTQQKHVTTPQWLAPFEYRQGKEMVGMYIEKLRNMDHRNRVNQLKDRLYRSKRHSGIDILTIKLD